MPRFFKRLAEGVFDEADLIKRTKERNDFLDEAEANYQLNRGNIVAFGYSNGANIAGSLLFHFKGTLKGVLLHHPMMPRRGNKLPDLTGTSVFIAAGVNDPLCLRSETEELEGKGQGNHSLDEHRPISLHGKKSGRLLNGYKHTVKQ
jgi:phospholipase/carboxylesterase